MTHNEVPNMKKVLLILVAVTLVIGICAIVYLHSDYYYAKRLVRAIEAEDKAAVEEIVRKRPGCINTYPSLATDGWNSAMDRCPLYPLSAACKTGNIEIIEFLVEAGADVNSNCGFTPLSLVYSYKWEGWYEVSCFLIDHGASVNYTTLHYGSEPAVFYDLLMKRWDDRSEEQEIVASFSYALAHVDGAAVNWDRVLEYSVSFDRPYITELLTSYMQPV